LQKKPFQIIVGDKEREGGLVAVRKQGKDLGQMTIEALLVILQKQSSIKPL
jgi:threonyl-tRNA synthetase